MIKSVSYPVFHTCLWVLFAACLATAGCSKSHVLYTRQARDTGYLYIDFERNRDPFRITVNPEKQERRTVKILGFEGNKFLIEVKRLKGGVQCRITGSGFDIRNCGSGEEAVMVREMEALISVTISSSPGSKYTLCITKI